jgi:hypothetical protein
MARCSAKCLTGKRCRKSATNGEFCWTHGTKETIDCGICLEETIKKSKYNIQLDCEHIFCKECIFTWLSTCKTKYFYCPMCKIRVSRQIKSIAWEYGVNNDLLYRIRIIKYDISKIIDYVKQNQNKLLFEIITILSSTKNWEDIKERNSIDPSVTNYRQVY